VWYKRAQEALRHYTDIGHYEPWTAPENKENKMVTLWQSDMSGGHFQMQETSPTAGGHTDYWEVSATVYKGRYDPFTDRVSIDLPFIKRELTANDVPNTLVNRLMSEFPTASIHVSENSQNGEKMVQIV